MAFLPFIIVRPSVCRLSVTIMHHAIENVGNVSTMIGGWRLLLPEILDQTDRVGAKSSIFDFFDKDCSVT